MDTKKLLQYFDDNAEILHVSRYHREGFRTHCLLVIGKLLEQHEAGNVSKNAVIAACLHDIAKPRTAALNKRNEACFYGHENVTEEEVAEFLSRDYPGFNIVVDLIRGHMLPIGIGENTPEPYRSKNKERFDAFLRNHDAQFEKDLMILSDCDLKSSIKSDEDLPSAEEEAARARAKLIELDL